eukprot:Plantae.Rhodophyta-Hildenbrandia_rubra.ctg9268.p1 GENE.Plantae.Rhodophyta-Hildenbrandia_rubra.ctg9268~~Plantae.Rhodophyta-Hildenbrandia_rubra.ctg9268.p1  ORF type:complete len:565 (-),score=107.38 Plantae.Rhodophyta-Hildenbrandia_rubra.ctg9268:5981-7675(-)
MSQADEDGRATGDPETRVDDTGGDSATNRIRRARLFLQEQNASRDVWGTSIESETPFMRTTTVIESPQMVRKAVDDKDTNVSFFGEDSDTDDSFGGQLLVDPAQSLFSSDDDMDSSDELGLFANSTTTPPVTQKRRRKVQNVGHFLLGPKLGEGAYAVVKEGLDQNSLRIVAVKILDLNRLRKIRGGRENLEREIEVQRALKKHENIIELIEVTNDDKSSKCYLFLEMANGCTVQELMDAAVDNRLPEGQVRFLMRQMINGLIYMHGRNVVHRDIKPSNMMLTARSELKISDFGVAEFLNAYAEGDNVTRTAGSPAFQAPEIAKGDSDFSGIKVDVWASGVTLFYLLTGSVPFQGENFIELFDQISKGEFTFPPGVSDEAKDLITGMLEKDWAQRLSPKEVLRHRWFKEVPDEDESDWVTVPQRTFRIMDTLNQMFEDDQEVARSPAVQQFLGKPLLNPDVRTDTPIPPARTISVPVDQTPPIGRASEPLPPSMRTETTEDIRRSQEFGNARRAENINNPTAAAPRERPISAVPANGDQGWIAQAERAVPVDTPAEASSRCSIM